jgi:membrane protease YdiL (CAAX protease family)
MVLGAELWVGLLRDAFAGWEQEMVALRKQLGIPLLLFVMALCPGVFEELAFRGLLQGRLAALLGRNQAIWATGAAFALAHGVTLGFPFHVTGGVYLCWLRARCDSLLPGMLLHMAYNATLVMIDVA